MLYLVNDCAQYNMHLTRPGGPWELYSGAWALYLLWIDGPSGCFGKAYEVFCSRDKYLQVNIM